MKHFLLLLFLTSSFGFAGLNTPSTSGGGNGGIVTVTAKSANFTVATTEKGSIFNVTTNSSNLIATLPDATTAGNGWYCYMRKVDSGAGYVALSPATLQAAPLNVKNDLTFLVSDGTNWIGKKTEKNIPQLQKFRAALAATRNGISDTKILCVGDSTTAGIGSSTTATIPASRAYPRQMGKLMNSYMVKAAQGIANPRRTGGDIDNRWTYGSGWTLSSILWSEATATAPSGALVYTPDGGETYDSFDVYYIRNGGLGNITVTATGGSASTISTSGTSGIGKLTVIANAAATTNSVTITATGAGVYITGVEPFLSTDAKVRVGNVGVPGSTSTMWNDGTTGYTRLNEIAAYAPALTIISLGINDANVLTTPATLKTNLQNIITQAKVFGDVILVGPPPSSGGNYQSQQILYQTIYEDLAATNNISLVSLFDRWGGVWNTLFMTDTVHPNDIGYGDMAQALFQLFAN